MSVWVVHVGDRLLRHGLEDRDGGVLADLRVHGTQHRVLAHHDLVPHYAMSGGSLIALAADCCATST